MTRPSPCLSLHDHTSTITLTSQCLFPQAAPWRLVAVPTGLRQPVPGVKARKNVYTHTHTHTHNHNTTHTYTHTHIHKHTPSMRDRGRGGIPNPDKGTRYLS